MLVTAIGGNHQEDFPLLVRFVDPVVNGKTICDGHINSATLRVSIGVIQIGQTDNVQFSGNE